MKNFVIATWGKDADLNTVFYPLLYDADSCLGLNNEGQLVAKPSMDLDTGDFMTVESRLWSRLTDKSNGFWSEIISRYAELRQLWFTEDKILEYHHTKFVDQIGQRFYNQDARVKYTKGEANQAYMYLINGTRREYTKRWIRERLVYLDSVFEYMTSFESKATIRTNVNDYLTLKMKAKSPRYIKIKWTDSLAYEKRFIGSDKYYTFTSPVPVTNMQNNLDMLGVEHIVDIETFTHLKPSYIQLDGMKSITRCVAQNSNSLTEVSIGKNKMLQHIDFSGCTELGKNTLGEATGNLNLINCANLKYLDVSNTSLISVNVVDIDANTPDPALAKGTGSLEFFNASGTQVTDITIWNQTYLDEIQLEECFNLATVSVGNCERLHTMSLPGTKISTFTIVDCEKLTYIDISNTAKLTHLRLDGCPNLETLIMQSVNSTTMPELDLTTCPKITTLDISNCGFLRRITFKADYTALENFYLSNSVLESIRFGKAEDFPAYLNLKPFSLNATKFYNCPKLVEIRDLNYYGSGSQLFFNCYNLETITGTITIAPGQNINQMFLNCRSLLNLPTLNLQEATGGSETCSGCSAFTMSQAVKIMNSLGADLKTTWRFFANCIEIEGEIPQTFFNHVPNLTSVNEFFVGCTGLTGTIPPTLFAPLSTSLKDVGRCFQGCNGLNGQLSDLFFAQNPNLENTYHCFSGCNQLTGGIPEDLFRQNLNLKHTYSMFYNCNNLTGRIPNTLFRYNKSLNDINAMFCGCTGLYGEVPMDLFQTHDESNYHSLWKINRFFDGCTGLRGTLTDQFFRYMPKLQEASGFFGNTKISGEIPENLFCGKASLSNIAGMFYNCTELTGGIPATLFKPYESYTSQTPKPLANLQDVSELFSGCTGLNGTIPSFLFEGCTNVTKVSNLFKDCRLLIGSIPEDILAYSTEILSIDSMFENCYQLSGPIPNNLFEKCEKVESMKNVFKWCYQLTGDIPEGLLDHCFKVKDMSGMFHGCKKLGNRYVNEEFNPYAFSPTLFEHCYALENVSHMFNMHGELGGENYLAGDIPQNLFEGRIKLNNMQEMFRSCNKLTGTLSTYFCAQSTQLQNAHGAFWGCSKLEGIEENVFLQNKALTNVSNLFNGCSALTGPVYEFWALNPKVTSFASCYKGVTGLTGEIPATWQ